MKTKFNKFKKCLSCLLVFVLICTICCGCNRESSEAMQIPEATSSETNGKKIEFNDFILAEDKIVKISLENFHVVEKLTDSGAKETKCATLKIENKTDHDIVIAFTRAYLDGEEVVVGEMSPNLVEAGRVSLYNASYNYHDATVVESLDKLYGLEWTMFINFFDESADRTQQYKLQFSVAEALN